MASNKHLYRRLYPHRIVGLGFAALAVGTVLWQHAAPAAHWGVVVAMLAWPHLAFGLARAAANPFRVERRNLIVDTVLVGVSLPLMSFSLLPIVILVLVALFDRVNLGVRRLARDALIGVVASAAVATLLLRPGLALESPLPVVLACLPLLAVHMLSVSLGMNRYVQIVVRQNRELETTPMATWSATPSSPRPAWPSASRCGRRTRPAATAATNSPCSAGAPRRPKPKAWPSGCTSGSRPSVCARCPTWWWAAASAWPWPAPTTPTCRPGCTAPTRRCTAPSGRAGAGFRSTGPFPARRERRPGLCRFDFKTLANVIPAKAGIQFRRARVVWIPAFAGTTNFMSS